MSCQIHKSIVAKYNGYKCKGFFRDFCKGFFSILTSNNILITASKNNYKEYGYRVLIEIRKLKPEIKIICQFHGKKDAKINDLIISPDEKYLLICYEFCIDIILLETYELIKTFEYPSLKRLVKCKFINNKYFIIFFNKLSESGYAMIDISFYRLKRGQLLEKFDSEIKIVKENLLKIVFVKSLHKIKYLNLNYSIKNINNFIIVKNKIIMKELYGDIQIIDFDGNLQYDLRINNSIDNISISNRSSFLRNYNNYVIFDFIPSLNTLYKLNLNNFKLLSEEQADFFYDKTFVLCNKYFNLLNDLVSKHFKMCNDIVRIIYNYLVDSVYVSKLGLIEIKS